MSCPRGRHVFFDLLMSFLWPPCSTPLFLDFKTENRGPGFPPPTPVYLGPITSVKRVSRMAPSVVACALDLPGNCPVLPFSGTGLKPLAWLFRFGHGRPLWPRGLLPAFRIKESSSDERRSGILPTQVFAFRKRYF